MTQPMYINPDSDTSVGNAAIESDDETLTIADHGLEDDDRIIISSLTGGAVGAVAEGGVYWVRDSTTNTFTISASRRGLPIEFGSDGTADINRFDPGYDARELRRMLSGMLYPDPEANRLDAREGLMPAKEPFYTLSGSDWTVHDNVFVVCPGITTTSGPYVAYLLESSNTLAPADGSNDRIDTIDIQIQDDDEDGSTFRRAHIVFTTGSPGSGEPAPVVNAYRALTLLVPQSGTGSPSILSRGDMTVMRGGVLPVRSDSELPDASAMPDGAMAVNIETGALLVANSGAWVAMANRHGYTYGGRVPFTSNGSFVKANYPGLRAVEVEVIGGGGGAGGVGNTTAGEAAEAGGGGGGGGSRKFILASALSSSETVTVGAAGNGGSTGNNDGGVGGTSSFGSHCQATGGSGGQGMAGINLPNDANHGNSGIGSNGDLNLNGSDGGNGRVIVDGSSGVAQAVMGNHGGAAAFGYGGQVVASNFSTNGQLGQFPGGGSAGPRNNPNDSGQSGRDGAAGWVVVTLYY